MRIAVALGRTIGISRIFLSLTALMILIGCNDTAKESDDITLPNGIEIYDEVNKESESNLFECKLVNGVPMRVIVKEKEAFAFQNQDLTGNKTLLTFFGRYFVFDESVKAYEIGKKTSRAEMMGWVLKDHVINWNTNQAVYFINKADDGVGSTYVDARIWLDIEDVGDRSKPHFGGSLALDETSKPFPVLRKKGDLVQVALLWDVEGAQQYLDSLSGGSIHGNRIERVKNKRETVYSNNQETIDEVLKEKRVDIVLVIDATASMTPYIEQVRANMIGIVNNLDEIDAPDAEPYVGVVAYRDYGENFVRGSFTVKFLPLTNDLRQVRQFLNDLDAVSLNNPYVPEAVWDGLSAEMKPEMGFGGKHVPKFLCVVGDAPPHKGEDEDIAIYRKKGLIPNSPFFGMGYKPALSKLKNMREYLNIQVYSFCVGRDEIAIEAFKDIASQDKYALCLEDDVKFIEALRSELLSGKKQRDLGIKTVQNIAEGRIKSDDLDKSKREALELIGIDDFSILTRMVKEPVQSGWFKPDFETATVSVYITRMQLENYQIKLMGRVRELLSNQSLDVDLFKTLLGPLVGNTNWKTPGEIRREASEVLIDPEKIILPGLSVSTQLEVTNIIKKRNELLRLGANEDIWSTNEEAWIALHKLPISTRN